MSKLLFKTQPLVVCPELATKIGLNEAIIIQQIHYWVDINTKSKRNFKDGYFWTYNSYPEWKKQFPFWSEPTIRRALTKLERLGYLVTGCYNTLKIDRTKWYRINYPQLEALDKAPSDQVDTPCDQNDQMDAIKMIRPLPETNYTETTTENNHNGAVNSTAPVEKPFLKEVTQCTTYYLETYKKYLGLKHPVLKKHQWDRIHEVMSDFVDENMIGIEELTRMVDRHFVRGIETDYNINHFGSLGILQNLMYMEAY